MSTPYRRPCRALPESRSNIHEHIGHLQGLVRGLTEEKANLIARVAAAQRNETELARQVRDLIDKTKSSFFQIGFSLNSTSKTSQRR